MKIADEYNPAFVNYGLTELMTTVQKGKKKKLPANYAVYTLLCEFLKDYGINLWGLYRVDDNLHVRSMRIDYRTFPVENELIIQQCYGYEDIEVEIALDQFEDRGYFILYNTKNGHCQLREFRYGHPVAGAYYESFKSMLSDLKKHGYELLNLDK